MVEARSDFAKKVSLRENKTLPNWKIISSITWILSYKLQKNDYTLHWLLQFQFLAKKMKINEKFKKC